MQKNPINLNIEDKRYLEQLINYKNNNPKTKLKAKVILLKSLKKDIATIMKETKLSKRTIINYTNEYINSVNKRHFFFKNNYKKSELSKHTSTILKEFRENPPITYKEATLRVEQLVDVKRSETQVRKFLNKYKIYTKRTRKLTYYTKRKLNQ